MMEDKRLLEIADKYKTPAFLFDEKSLKDRMRKIREIAGESVHICYSIKANPFLIPAMLEVAGKLEVCSPGELNICKALGVAADRIVYSGVNKTAEDIADAYEYGVGVYTAESLKHVALLQEQADKAGEKLRVLLRLNGGSQFGMSREDCFRVFENTDILSGLEIIGIHYFCGTQRKKTDDRIKELSMLREFYKEIEKKFGVKLTDLEYGPGLPYPYFESDDRLDTLAPLKEVADALKDMAGFCNLTVEMGRFFASECGYYLTKVMDIKENEGTNYAILDGGMNHLSYFGQVMGMKIPLIRHLRSGKVSDPLYKKLTETEESFEGIKAESSEGENKKDYCLCGSLCTTADVIVRKASFEDLRIGDVLAFCSIGAYSVTEGIHLFLSRTMPIILLAGDDGNIRIARDFTESSPINTIQDI